MLGKDAKTWQELCEQAAVEQDHKKLLELVAEINRLLDKKADRLKTAQAEGNEKPVSEPQA